MGKYDGLKLLKQTKARVDHICSNCGKKSKPAAFIISGVQKIDSCI